MMMPQLRFPEFTDEWTVTKLKDVSQRGQYGMNAAAKTYDGINKYLRITDIDEESRKILEAGLTSPDAKLEDKYLLADKDILFTRTGASTGKSYLYDSADGRVYFAGFLIRFHINNAVPSFVYSQTLRAEYAKWVTTVSARSGQPGINAEEYGLYIFFQPSIPEQQKIADFLTTVDDKITALDKKVELLKQYKKGVMQQIFSQQVRFKDENGQNYPEWEEKKLNEVFKERLDKGGADRRMLSVTINSGIVPFSEGGRKDSSSANKSNYKHVELNDIAYNSMRMWQGASGVSRYTGIVSPAYTVITTNPSNDPTFWGYYFKLRKTIQTFERNSQGLTSDTWNLKYSALSKIQLHAPLKSEQQKIADLLTTLDDKITAEQTRLDAAKEWKKGLLQRMFV